MEIQVRTDYHVNGDEGFVTFVRERVSSALDPYAARITRVQVHLREESGARKGPADLICMLEVRLAGYAPVVVRRHAATKDEVIASAVDGMRVALGRLFDRLDHGRAGAASIRQAH